MGEGWELEEEWVWIGSWKGESGGGGGAVRIVGKDGGCGRG